MRLSDLRLVDGVEPIPLGGEIARYHNADNVFGTKPSKSYASALPWTDHDEVKARRTPSPYASHRLAIEELDDGGVCLTRPDGLQVHIYRHALLYVLVGEGKSK